MSIEDVRTSRNRTEVHARWTSTVNLALVLGFIAYVLTMCFWR